MSKDKVKYKNDNTKKLSHNDKENKSTKFN